MLRRLSKRVGRVKEKLIYFFAQMRVRKKILTHFTRYLVESERTEK